MPGRLGRALQTSPGGAHRATNPKTWRCDAPSALQASHWLVAVVTPSLPRLPLPGGGAGRGRLRSPLALAAVAALQQAARRRGAGRGRGARRPGAPARRRLRDRSMRGGGRWQGRGAPAGAEGGRRGPARPAAPSPASPGARPTQRDALRCSAPLPWPCPEAESWGAGGHPPPPAPMIAPGLLPASLDCALPALSGSSGTIPGCNQGSPPRSLLPLL